MSEEQQWAINEIERLQSENNRMQESLEEIQRFITESNWRGAAKQLWLAVVNEGLGL